MVNESTSRHKHFLNDQWQALMVDLSLALNENMRDALLLAYQQSHRHYHTQAHLNDCLEKWLLTKHMAKDASAIALALWFHDAVYAPMRSDNEAQSAQWAMQFMQSVNLSAEKIDIVQSLIMATLHNATPDNSDAQLLIDIDLSILGASVNRYNQFESDVRKEYRWVPWFIYRKKRAQILQRFLDRPRIYTHAWFFERYEIIARENLNRAIDQLIH